ncbi:gliding motility-associated C-terminal domain-containing protein [Allomuricauda sp. d1]|uniref:T9SS type B sorting domain-containing protein n=1 Tax=Allomuricauda sp. d1 TaxID=3136725 RepID=UPI0031DC2C63
MRPILLTRILLVAACALFGAQVSAQDLNKPTPAPNPNIGASDPWDKACASDTFNEYFVNFTWSPNPIVNSDNEFILELSDASGDFSSPVELDRRSDMNATFDFDFNFALPTDVRGSGYRMRVRSTSPAVTSPASDAYSMYYIDYKLPILISQDGNGTIPPGGEISLCDGNSIVLQPHNVPNANTYQYIWYRSGTILSEKSESLTVSTAGMYSVEIDYGTCSGSANTLSNVIDITTGSSQGVAINPPAKTNLCPGETVTLQANVTGQGLDYTWYKDGNPVTGPTLEGDSYVVDASIAGFEGDYEVEISGTGVCQERSSAVTMTNAGDFTVTRDNAATIVLLPSQTTNLSVSTTATTPTYQWYKDGSPISGETNSTITVNDIGTYFARVTESGGACAATPKDSETTSVVAPASFELVVDYSSSYTACSSTDVTLGMSVINAVASDGSKTDVTSDMLGAFSYQWTRGGSDISGETSSTLVITDNADNGSFALQGTVDSFNATSNTLEVRLRTSETVAITSTETVLCVGTNNVTISTARDLSGETFEWQRNGQNTGAATADLAVTESGSYQLVVTVDGCPVPSNTIEITDFDASQLVLDSETTIIFPEGESQTVTASGAANYEWYDANNALISSTDSATFTEEGNYLLIATIGNCQVSRALTVEYRDNFQVPNVITANGDGINDLWVLPNTYSRRADVTVTVFNEKGQEILNQANYQNNWPQSSTAFAQQNMIFYYKIRKENKTIKQGTITVIR